MNCRVLSAISVKSNGEIPCDDDNGYKITLGKIGLSPEWSVLDLVNNERYQEIRNGFKTGCPPWKETCENCALFNRGEAFSDGIENRKIALRIEPSLDCALDCLCCRRRIEVKRRAGEIYMKLEVFDGLLKSCRESNLEVDSISYLGWGEPLNHPQFYRFAASASSVFPKSVQTLTTNGNRDYHESLRDEHIDQIIVSCDGLHQESYEKYRRNGLVSLPLKFMYDAKSLPRKNSSNVQWKYVLFEFNDSENEVIDAQKKAQDIGVDSILFLVTNSKFRSKRYTIGNINNFPIVSPIASIDVVPWLSRTKYVSETVLTKGFINSLKALKTSTLCYIDKISVTDEDLLDIEGWAANKKGNRISFIDVYYEGKSIGKFTTHLSRPDVAAVHPNMESDRVGFSMKRIISPIVGVRSTLSFIIHTVDGKRDIRRFTCLFE